MIQSSQNDPGEYETVIRELRSRRRELVQATNSELGEMGHAVGTSDNKDASSYHIEDSTSDFVNSSLFRIQFEELTKIDAALKRIENGQFGRCEGCQAAIAVERLEVLPFASMCVTCQSELENSGQDGGDLWN